VLSERYNGSYVDVTAKVSEKIRGQLADYLHE
jgi:hypothetical protein